MMMDAGAEVFVRRGRLMCRALPPLSAMLRGVTLHPDDAEDRYVFRLDLSEYGLGTMQIDLDGTSGRASSSPRLECECDAPCLLRAHGA